MDHARCLERPGKSGEIAALGIGVGDQGLARIQTLFWTIRVWVHWWVWMDLRLRWGCWAVRGGHGQCLGWWRTRT